MLAADDRPRVATILDVVLASLRMRLLTISRYPGAIVIDILIPIVFASMPILLGRATAGPSAAENFSLNTGSSNYAAYMLLGSSVFMLVTYAFWHIAYWLRWEQETGTLESLYLTPTSTLWLAAGVGLYSTLRSAVSAAAAYLIGSAVFGVNPWQGDLVRALLFVLVGLVPLYALTLLFGAVVIRVKEANALVGLMQWVVSLLMGTFFPVAVFPPLMRAVALAFPPTWMMNGVRAALLDVEYFFGRWYLDWAVLWAFLLIAPWLGAWVFASTERRLRADQGLGQF
jgi:ABC-2 type transport system permease protein